MFEAAKSVLGDIETEIYYGTDVVETIFEAAADHDATAVVVTPRGGSRFVQLITGDVALRLITENDHPVVVLPDSEPSTDEEVTDGDG
ncbi:universal stress protein [Halomicroarcula sp. GCM10025709]